MLTLDYLIELVETCLNFWIPKRAEKKKPVPLLLQKFDYPVRLAHVQDTTIVSNHSDYKIIGNHKIIGKQTATDLCSTDLKYMYMYK